MQCKEYSDANSELFKEEYDEALHENTCEIEFCDLISVSLKGGTPHELPLHPLTPTKKHPLTPVLF